MCGLLYPPQTSLGGYIGITLSVCLSVWPSVRLSVQAFKRALIFLIFLIFCQRSLFSLFKLQIPKNPLFFHENPNFTIIFLISKTSLAKKSKSSQIKLYIVYFQIVIVLNQCISVKTCCGYQHYSAWICMVAYFCHHLSDNYVDLSDLYVDLSDLYVDLSENNHHD